MTLQAKIEELQHIRCRRPDLAMQIVFAVQHLLDAYLRRNAQAEGGGSEAVTARRATWRVR